MPPAHACCGGVHDGVATADEMSTDEIACSAAVRDAAHKTRTGMFASRQWRMPNWLAMSLLCIGCVASQAVHAPSFGLESPGMSPLAAHLPTPEQSYMAPARPAPLTTRWERSSKPPDEPDDWYSLPAPPPGHGYMSMPIDSACTAHMLKDKRWFSWLRPAHVSIQTASDVTEAS